MLLRAGSATEAQNTTFGWTALIAAACSGHEEIAFALVTATRNCNARDFSVSRKLFRIVAPCTV